MDTLVAAEGSYCLMTHASMNSCFSCISLTRDRIVDADPCTSVKHNTLKEIKCKTDFLNAQ